APSGHNYVTSLTYDGKYVYAGYSVSPGIVDQVSPSTMGLVKSFTAPGGHGYVLSLVGWVGNNYAVFP
ncbi:MAG: hypothetical protein QW429_02805, partial [Thermoprotei archaeon]